MHNLSRIPETQMSSSEFTMKSMYQAVTSGLAEADIVRRGRFPNKAEPDSNKIVQALFGPQTVQRHIFLMGLLEGDSE